MTLEERLRIKFVLSALKIGGGGGAEVPEKSPPTKPLFYQRGRNTTLHRQNAIVDWAAAGAAEDRREREEVVDFRLEDLDRSSESCAATMSLMNKLMDLKSFIIFI